MPLGIKDKLMKRISPGSPNPHETEISVKTSFQESLNKISVNETRQIVRFKFLLVKRIGSQRNSNSNCIKLYPTVSKNIFFLSFGPEKKL